MRSSSCGLSALTAIPSASASRSSAGGLGGGVEHGAAGRYARRPGERQLARAGDLGADALRVEQQPQHRYQRARPSRRRRAAQGCRAGDARRRRRAARRRPTRMPATSRRATTGRRAPSQSLFHGGPHRLVAPGRRGGGVPGGAVRVVLRALLPAVSCAVFPVPTVVLNRSHERQPVIRWATTHAVD